MSKVRINDLAREMEVKSRQILDVLGELGLGEGKTHSSSIEDHEADKVRAHFQHGRQAGHAGAGSSRASHTIAPKIDLSHVSKPGDVMKAILAKKQEEEAEARRSHLPSGKAAASAPTTPAKPAPPVVSLQRRRQLPHGPNRGRLYRSRDLPQRLLLRRSSHCVEAAGWNCCGKGARRSSRRAACRYGCSAHRGCKTPATPAAAATPTKPAEQAPAAAKPVAPKAAAPAAAVPVAPPVHEKREAAAPIAPPSAPVVEAPIAQPAEIAAKAEETSSAPATTPAEPQAPAAQTPETAPARPVVSPRRVVMPQTGPRPVYKAPIRGGKHYHPGSGTRRRHPARQADLRPPSTVRTSSRLSATHPRHGRPSRTISRRRPASQAPYAYRICRPRRTRRSRWTSRIWRAPWLWRSASRRLWRSATRSGGAPPTGEAPRPQRAPQNRARRGGQQYPKTKEGPMKGFVPPPRFGWCHTVQRRAAAHHA